MKRITLIVLIVATLVGCETALKRPLTWQERMVRAEENRVRALRAMIIMQGIANGLQSAGNNMQLQALSRPQPIFINPVQSIYQPHWSVDPRYQIPQQLGNINSKLNNIDHALRWNSYTRGYFYP
jgi:predicted component of type VI protein secretion system